MQKSCESSSAILRRDGGMGKRGTLLRRHEGAAVPLPQSLHPDHTRMALDESNRYSAVWDVHIRCGSAGVRQCMQGDKPHTILWPYQYICRFPKLASPESATICFGIRSTTLTFRVYIKCKLRRAPHFFHLNFRIQERLARALAEFSETISRVLEVFESIAVSDRFLKIIKNFSGGR